MTLREPQPADEPSTHDAAYTTVGTRPIKAINWNGRKTPNK